MIRQNGEAVPPLRGGLFAKASTSSLLLSFFHRRHDYEDSIVPSARLGKAPRQLPQVLKPVSGFRG